MIKELSTMAVVAVMTTTMSNQFDSIMRVVTEMETVHQKAGTFVNDPNQFLKSVESNKANLIRYSQEIAALDIKKEAGPFGVALPEQK